MFVQATVTEALFGGGGGGGQLLGRLSCKDFESVREGTSVPCDTMSGEKTRYYRWKNLNTCWKE